MRWSRPKTARPDSIAWWRRVTDLNMPVMDGLAMTERVRTNPRTSAMPVLMVTTESSPEMREKGRVAGATGWITKPYAPQKLVSSVRRICQ
jgi:two-component system, chemotaxis family, chemotaxis protein CheY